MLNLKRDGIVRPIYCVVAKNPQRANAWRKLLAKNSGCCCGIGKNKEVFHQVLKERMIVAYDLAVAFMYLHENR